MAKKTTFVLSDRHYNILKEEAKRLEISVTDVLRRLIDEKMAGKK